MFELSLLLILLAVVLWVYSVDNKKTKPPVVNITLNVDGLDNTQTGNRQQTTSINENPSMTPNKKKAKKKVIPIEEPPKKASTDWKDITPTDSNL